MLFLLVAPSADLALRLVFFVVWVGKTSCSFGSSPRGLDSVLSTAGGVMSCREGWGGVTVRGSEEIDSPFSRLEKGLDGIIIVGEMDMTPNLRWEALLFTVEFATGSGYVGGCCCCKEEERLDSGLYNGCHAIQWDLSEGLKAILWCFFFTSLFVLVGFHSIYLNVAFARDCFFYCRNSTTIASLSNPRVIKYAVKSSDI